MRLRPRFAPYCLLIVLSIPPFVASAQMDMSQHVMEMKDEMPPGQLPAPRKMTGIGNVHLRITANREAQMWFNQGLNLLHDFWDYESARAFEQGIRADPQCAMCYWGLYKAEAFYHSIAQGYAHQALDQAVALEHHVSKRERLYIQAAAAHLNASKKAGAPSEADILRRLVKKYPRESEARIALAGAVGHDESVALLRSVLKQDPNNSAANHLYIHALEATDHPEQALHSAEILPSLAPSSGHMVHMPGHIFFRIGDYARAEHAFAASMQVDERYMRDQHVYPDNDWNYVHNLMYAVANLMEEGKLEEASNLSAKLTGARGEFESTLYVYSVRDSISRLNPRLPVALRMADWPQVIALLSAATVPAGRPNLEFLAQQLTRFAAAMQAVESHDLAKAQELSSDLDRASRTSPSTHAPAVKPPSAPPQLQVMPDALLPPILNTLSIMSLELKACILTAGGNVDKAKALFATAAQQEKALGYHEPPSYIRPVGETEGAAMLEAGDWADAKAAYQQALRERPCSGLDLYGIALACEKSGDATDAAKEYSDFLAAWKDADPNLNQLTHAKMYLATHPIVAAGA
ncbi:MAG: tetratricopeptide repeat protein [Bryobacteraceae bacterium]